MLGPALLIVFRVPLCSIIDTCLNWFLSSYSRKKPNPWKKSRKWPSHEWASLSEHLLAWLLVRLRSVNIGYQFWRDKTFSHIAWVKFFSFAKNNDKSNTKVIIWLKQILNLGVYTPSYNPTVYFATRNGHWNLSTAWSENAETIHIIFSSLPPPTENSRSWFLPKVQHDIIEIFSRILHQGNKGGKNVAIKTTESNRTFRLEITTEKKLTLCCYFLSIFFSQMPQFYTTSKPFTPPLYVVLFRHILKYWPEYFHFYMWFSLGLRASEISISLANPNRLSHVE